MKGAQAKARWMDEVEEIFEECKQGISEAVKEYEASIKDAIDELKGNLKSDL